MDHAETARDRCEAGDLNKTGFSQMAWEIDPRKGVIKT